MTTLLNKQLAQVIETLKQSATSDLISIYNEYASTNNYDSVYDNDSNNINMMFNNSYAAIRSAFYGDYNPSHAYFTFNGYGNLQSFEYLDCDNCPIDVEELAQWLLNEDKLSDYDIEVTTLDDMLNSIEDNITDDSYLMLKLAKNLGVNISTQSNNSYDDNVADVMNELSDYDYNQLSDIITLLGINYE